MLTITLLAVGKLKEKYWADACMEYAKRLSGYCKLTIMETSDFPTPENPKETERVPALEGKCVLSKIPVRSFVVALCVEGQEMSSEEFSETIQKLQTDGVSHITFIIGGSLGLSEEVKKAARLRLSFSRMTFPHRLMRVILLEQIYRALKIAEDGNYHK